MLFGEHLVSIGLISEEQMQEAASRQALYGGRIGTNLVQLGHTDLDTIGKQLAKFYRLPVAEPGHFDNADPDVQRRLPHALALKYQAVPLWFGDNGKVMLAVMEPVEDDSELAAALGFPVSFAVAGELRIAYQLENVYGIKRPQHLLRSDPITDNADPNAEGAHRRRFIKTLSDVDAENDTKRTAMERPIPKLDEEQSAIGKIALKRISKPRIAAPKAPEPEEPATVRSVISSIRKANDRDKIADLVLQGLELFQEGQLDAAVLWVIRGSVAICWKSFSRAPSSDMSEVALPLSEQSVLLSPISDRDTYIGPCPDPTVLDQRLFERVGTTPKHIVAAPIVVLEQPVCVLYGHSQEPFWPDALEEMVNLCKATKLAFQRLIRATSR